MPGSMILPTDFSPCGSPGAIKMTGSVGPAVDPTYLGVGYVGFNIAQDPSGSTPIAIKPTGSGLTVTFAATSGGLPLRLQLGADSAGTEFWCKTIDSPASGSVTVAYGDFKKECWGTTGTAFNKATDSIMSIQFTVPGGMLATSGVSVEMKTVKENP